MSLRRDIHAYYDIMQYILKNGNVTRYNSAMSEHMSATAPRSFQLTIHSRQRVNKCNLNLIHYLLILHRS